ncbi:MAG: glycosyl hydrolase family 28-related protein, partial [Tepidisphaeraceae bacterium]
MKLRYPFCQLHPISLLVATFLAGTIASGLEAQDASVATTRPQVVVDAASQGIVGDGATLNTPAIQSAIDSLSSHGGGVLEFPAGRYVTGTIQLKDNVRLRLGPGAILLGSHNPEDYRILEPFLTGDGGNMGYALVTAVDASHVGIEGSGTIDGQGKSL